MRNPCLYPAPPLRALPQPLPASGTADGNRGRAQAPAAIPPGPVIEYASSRQEGGLGLAVVGGYVYRGSALAQFGRRYAFGDSSQSFGGPPSGKLLVAKPRMRRLWQLGNSAPPPTPPASSDTASSGSARTAPASSTCSPPTTLARPARREGLQTRLAERKGGKWTRHRRAVGGPAGASPTERARLLADDRST
jgi:hypothetical protein